MNRRCKHEVFYLNRCASKPNHQYARHKDEKKHQVYESPVADNVVQVLAQNVVWRKAEAGGIAEIISTITLAADKALDTR